MTRHILPLTYAPKIPAVLSRECRQTIRAGRKFQVGDLVMFHGWEGRPYRSPWSFRTPYYQVVHIEPIRISKNSLFFESTKEGLPWFSEILNLVAEEDGIDPPTGIELGRVLLSMHKIPEEGLPAQIIRWNPEPLTGVEK